MNIYKTAVILSDPGDNKIYHADTIEYEGKLWIVPTWIESPFLSYKLPERIVCLQTLRHQKSDTHGVDYILNDPIPRYVLYGQIPHTSEYAAIVRIRPDIKVPIPKIH